MKPVFRLCSVRLFVDFTHKCSYLIGLPLNYLKIKLWGNSSGYHSSLKYIPYSRFLFWSHISFPDKLDGVLTFKNSPRY